MPKLDHVLQDPALHVASTFNTWLTCYEEIESSVQLPGCPLTTDQNQPSLEHQRWKPCRYGASTPDRVQQLSQQEVWLHQAVPTSEGLTVKVSKPSGERSQKSLGSHCHNQGTHPPCNGKSIKVIPRPPNTAWLYLPLVARRWSHATWSTCVRSILLVDGIFSRGSWEIFS